MSVNFSPTNWVDNSQPAITAAQLNRMEKGIEDCSSQGNANELAIAANAEAIQTLESGIQLGSISITQLLLMAHPIGSIYSSTAATSPADLFGGTWERIKGRFIWGIEDGETAGITGGEAAHTLTVDEMPTHRHPMYYYTNGGGVSSGSDYQGDRAVPLEQAVGSRETSWHQMFQAEAGGNQPHNNKPPYLAVYVWKRTA